MSQHACFWWNIHDVKEFGGVVNTNIWDDEVQKQVVHHTCIVCINIDSILAIKKKRIIHDFI